MPVASQGAPFTAFSLTESCIVATVAAGESTSLDLSRTDGEGRVLRVPDAALALGKVETLGLSRSIRDATTASFKQKMDEFGRRDLKRVDLDGNRLMVSCWDLTLRPSRTRPWVSSRVHPLTLVPVVQQCFQDVPDSILSMPTLQQLSLTDNALKTLPPSIAQLRLHLVELDVRQNFLETLPDAVGELQNLRLLSVGRNKIRTLPESLWTLQQLTSLWLDHNRLREIPSACSRLPALEDLNLHENRIDVLPDAIVNAPTLACAHNYTSDFFCPLRD